MTTTNLPVALPPTDRKLIAAAARNQDLKLSTWLRVAALQRSREVLEAVELEIDEVIREAAGVIARGAKLRDARLLALAGLRGGSGELRPRLECWPRIWRGLPPKLRLDPFNRSFAMNTTIPRDARQAFMVRGPPGRSARR